MWSKRIAGMTAWRWLAAYSIALFMMVGIENWHAIFGGPHGQSIHIIGPIVRSSIIFFTVAISPMITNQLQREREKAPRFEATRARSGEILPPTWRPKPIKETEEPGQNS